MAEGLELHETEVKREDRSGDNKPSHNPREIGAWTNQPVALEKIWLTCSSMDCAIAGLAAHAPAKAAIAASFFEICIESFLAPDLWDDRAGDGRGLGKTARD